MLFSYIIISIKSSVKTIHNCKQLHKCEKIDQLTNFTHLHTLIKVLNVI